MKRHLRKLADTLTEQDLHDIAAFKKEQTQQRNDLIKKRTILAARLHKIDTQLASHGAAGEQPVKRGRGRPKKI